MGKVLLWLEFLRDTCIFFSLSCCIRSSFHPANHSRERVFICRLLCLFFSFWSSSKPNGGGGLFLPTLEQTPPRLVCEPWKATLVDFQVYVRLTWVKLRTCICSLVFSLATLILAHSREVKPISPLTKNLSVRPVGIETNRHWFEESMEIRKHSVLRSTCREGEHSGFFAFFTVHVDRQLTEVNAF